MFALLVDPSLRLFFLASARRCTVWAAGAALPWTVRFGLGGGGFLRAALASETCRGILEWRDEVVHVR